MKICKTQPRFQSHNGAIAAFVNLWESMKEAGVSIPQWCDCCCIQCTDLRLTIEFQSHNGAIAANRKEGETMKVTEFQSHNGAIAAAWLMFTVVTKVCFNPTMVRLLLHPVH